MTPNIIRKILSSRIVEVAARILLTFPFWASGLGKMMNFPAAAEESSTCGDESFVQAERSAAPAAIATRRERGAVVIGIQCHGPAKFTRFPAWRS